ncbi:MAG: hypothetical protein AABX88_02680 [Nanoarchaeota archaeon]
MQELIKLIIGVAILLVGYPLGIYLAHLTKEELKSGQIWFKYIVILSLVGGIVGLMIGNDVLLFTFFFIAIVTSRSLKKNARRKN